MKHFYSTAYYYRVVEEVGIVIGRIYKCNFRI